MDLGLNYGYDKRSLDQTSERVYELPFDSQRKLMTTVHRLDNGYRIFTKGGTDELLDKCDRILLNGSVESLTLSILQVFKSQ